MPTNITAYELYFERMNRRERSLLATANQVTINDETIEPQDIEDLKTFLFLINDKLDLEQMSAKADANPQKRAYKTMVALFGRRRTNELLAPSVV